MTIDIYSILRSTRTPDVSLGSLYTDDGSYESTVQDSANMMLADRNVDYLTNAIVSRADQSQLVGDIASIKNSIRNYLISWRNLGKFDNPVPTISPNMRIDAFNQEFIQVFTPKIIPSNSPMKVTSVVDPGGIYAQQERSLIIKSKAPPFYERALYKRLNDMHLDLPEDETETLFYRMDHNPRLTKEERKKTEPTEPAGTYLDRVGLSFRMKPNYH